MEPRCDGRKSSSTDGPIPAKARNARVSPADARVARVSMSDRAGLRARAFRVAMVFGLTGLGFLGVAGQLLRLGLSEQGIAKSSISRPLSATYSRPDVIDNRGNLLATDVVMQSLYADPSRLLSVDETLEALATVIDDINTPSMRRLLSNKERRFAWLKRGLSPATAQKIHELGLPGLEFKPEPRRSYPQGRVAGHLIGHVNVDNRGTSGIELYIDEKVGVQQVFGDPQVDNRQVQLTIDLNVQAALEQELAAAMQLYSSKAATGIILDVTTGAVRAAASLPSSDPANPIEAQHLKYLDRLKRGTYELGSIFKAVTIANALEKRTITTATKFDTRNPIEIGRFRISDHRRHERPLTVEEIFVLSSNVGTGLIAREVGRSSQEAFLRKLGLLDAMETDSGPTAAPLLPANWGNAEVVTIAYGHGLAIAPLQFAVAGAALVNGGFLISPRFIEAAETARPTAPSPSRRVLSDQTSAAIRSLMRANVAQAEGTGTKADVAGYEVGGKTGTADLAVDGRYDGSAVVTSFFAAFPMTKPRFVLLVTLHEPTRSGPDKTRSASLNAAPTAGRIIERSAPLLGVFPKSADKFKARE